MRHLDPFDRRAMALSIALHATIFALGWLSTLNRGPQIEFITYEIELVSPPPGVQAEEYTPPQEELVVERPEPERPEPEPEPEPEPQVRVEDPVPAPREPEPTPPQPEPTPPATAVPAAGPDPSPEPAARTGEGINVRMEGLRRDYPEYYNNIIRQILRCFRWRDGGSWEAVVYFSIQRDGSVRDLRFTTRSGNASFDFEAMGAVECAGEGGRFGPLPTDLPFESQPVNFRFSPSGGEE